MTTPDQLATHNTDPTSQLPIEEQVRAYFEQKAWDPSMEIERLGKGESTKISGLDASHIPGISDLLPEMSGVDVKALVEIPVDLMEHEDGSRAGDYAYFAIGKGANNGWFFARVGTKRADMDVPKGDLINRAQSPLEMGSEVGLKVEVGRPAHQTGTGGFVFSGFPGTPSMLRTMPNFSSEILKEFGQSTSRKHISLTVEQSGLKITDESTYGTRVLKMPDLQRPV